MVMHLYDMQEWKLFSEFMNLWISRCCSFYVLLYIALVVGNMVMGYSHFDDGCPKNISDWGLLFLVSLVLSGVIEIAIAVLVPLVIAFSLPLVTGIAIEVAWLYLREDKS